MPKLIKSVCNHCIRYYDTSYNQVYHLNFAVPTKLIHSSCNCTYYQVLCRDSIGENSNFQTERGPSLLRSYRRIQHGRLKVGCTAKYEMFPKCIKIDY